MPYRVTLTANNEPTFLQSGTYDTLEQAQRDSLFNSNPADFVQRIREEDGMTAARFLKYIGAEDATSPILWGWEITEE